MTIEDFNREYIAHRRAKGERIKLHQVSGFSLYKNKATKDRIEGVDQNGIPYTYTKVTSTKKVFDTNQFNKAIVAFLHMYTSPLKASVTNTTGRYIPKVGFVANKADRGRADITAEYKDFILEIETKQRNERQLDSQKKHQARAEQTSYKRYILVRSWDEFVAEMVRMFDLKL